jgi:hypothetical protein
MSLLDVTTNIATADQSSASNARSMDSSLALAKRYQDKSVIPVRACSKDCLRHHPVLLLIIPKPLFLLLPHRCEDAEQRLIASGGMKCSTNQQHLIIHIFKITHLSTSVYFTTSWIPDRNENAGRAEHNLTIA